MKPAEREVLDELQRQTQRHQEFQSGDKVSVQMPGGKMVGTITDVLTNYSWTGQNYYRIAGANPPFETIAPARVMEEA